VAPAHQFFDELLVYLAFIFQHGKNFGTEYLFQFLGLSLGLAMEGAIVKAIIFSGTGKFFSFGFDIPEFLSYSKDEFSRYLTKFTDLCLRLYLFLKPVVAALNGHTIAGGCMLALTSDYRIMESGKAKISLNEITFGSTVFSGIAEMLRCLVGERNAERILLTGSMYSAQEARQLGLIDETADPLHLNGM